MDEAAAHLNKLRGTERIAYCAGNGGSAATASHFATDLVKYCSPEPGRAIRAESLVDNSSLLTALVNDIGWSDVYVHQLERKLRPTDTLVLFSVHGGAGEELAGEWSQNLIRAAILARSLGAHVIAFVGFTGGPLSDIADTSILMNAWSTPIVEGWHSLAAHLIVETLQEGSV
ncbi:D-sedoheptulose-7-phosphate isomerase [Kribbella solani]|uniref:D-sedoheptulose-7-phosphate isomerase n=1 Tax=Kribbella solani TaxID=236067 RepID=UPI0029B4BD30|nr:SIS domain-containing protein [Kribbella solani]MDX2972177.1 SIS domain-containing protein [Kribbella solani]